jgi:hypothetical protein
MRGSANGGSATTQAVGGGIEERRDVFDGRALLGLQDEAAAFVEIDAADGDVAVAVVHGDGALEDVGVVAIVGDGWLGTGDLEEIAEFREEQRLIGPLGGAGLFPALYKVANRGLVVGGELLQAKVSRVNLWEVYRWRHGRASGRSFHGWRTNSNNSFFS